MDNATTFLVWIAVVSLPRVVYSDFLDWVSFMILGCLAFYWWVQLNPDQADQLRIKEWEVSMMVFILYIRIGCVQYIKYKIKKRGEKGNGIVAPAPLKRLYKIILAILFLINYILVSVYGLYHTTGETHHPIFAWVLFSCYLLLFLIKIFYIT